MKGGVALEGKALQIEGITQAQPTQPGSFQEL